LEKEKAVAADSDSLADKVRSGQFDPEAGSVPVKETDGPVVVARSVEIAPDGIDSRSNAITTGQYDGPGLRTTPVSDQREGEYFAISLSAGSGSIQVGCMDKTALA
jgi:hypothetical protein